VVITILSTHSVNPFGALHWQPVSDELMGDGSMSNESMSHTAGAVIPAQIILLIERNRETLLVLAFAVAGVVLFQILRSPHPFDDAFITFRYARSIAAGAGFVYNPAEPVLGTTTPLYTLILAALAFVFGAQHLLTISLGIAALADIASIVLLYRLSRHILHDRLLAVPAERHLPAASPAPGGGGRRHGNLALCHRPAADV
jgi:hypothetical protein